MLAQGTPAELVGERKAPTLEAAFIGYLEDAAAADKDAAEAAAAAKAPRRRRRKPAPRDASPAASASRASGRSPGAKRSSFATTPCGWRSRCSGRCC